MSQVWDSIHFGCGWRVAENWLNFDASPTLRFERIPILGTLYTKNDRRFPDAVQYGDIVAGLPIPPASASRLYSSHVLEHLSYEDALRAIENCFTVLKPGGVFRLIVPDLRARAEAYVAAAARGDMEAANVFMESTMLGERLRSRGLRGLLVGAFGGSAHRWMWDEASLTTALKGAGFCDIRRCSFGDSGDPLFKEVEDIDRFMDSGAPELALECRRPA